MATATSNGYSDFKFTLYPSPITNPENNVTNATDNNIDVTAIIFPAALHLEEICP